jgi:hypothetical protein
MTPAELFASLEEKYKLPAGFLNRTWQIESGSGRNMLNQNSGAAGHFQFIPRTARQYGLRDPNSLPESAEAAARLAVDNRAALERAGVESPNAAQLYLAHQQGAGGALKLLRSQDPATSVVGEKAVLWNAGQKDQTGADFASAIMAKFGGGSAPRQQVASSGGQTWGEFGQSLLGGATGGLLGQTPVPSKMNIDTRKYPESSEPGYSGEPGKMLQAAASDYGFTNYAPSAGSTASQLAGLASAGSALMAAGAPKPTWTPAPPPPAVRGKWNEDLFKGLFGFLG